MAENRVKDMTIGSPLRLVISFMLPLLGGLLFQQFYNMVDTIVVGQFLGVDALAGVGSTGSINFLVLGLCNGICAGFAIPVAQKFGQRDFAGLRRFVGNMIWLGSFFAILITVLTTTLCRSILVWMHNPADTFEYAYNYIFLIFLGIPATMLYNLLSGIIRSLGDSRTPLLFLIFSSLLNVALDVVFIVTLKLGVAGAGLATFISQLLSGLLCIGYIAKNFPILHLHRADLRFDMRYARHLLTMGLPMGLQYSITAIGSIVLQTAVNGLGSSVMAAMTAGGKVSLFAMTPIDALAGTAATFAGQNLGAGKPERVHESMKCSSLIGGIYCILAFFVLGTFGGKLSMIFLDSRDAAAVAQILPLASRFLRINAAFYIPLLFVNLLRFTIQGLGYSQLAMFAGAAEMVARAGVALCLVPQFGFDAVCFANPSAWIMADLFLFPAYYFCLKKRGYKIRLTRKKLDGIPQ